ncbi:MAG: T9SS type A sorting domain-containing protein [Paludibacter sp.]|nr:T9SS type A sorting domain-containing protein [Paludibacter sp.]
MKKILLIICILGSIINMKTNAQTSFWENAFWTQAFVSDQGGKIVRQIQYYIDNDSIIIGKIYKNIIAHYPENPQNRNYIGSIREDLGKISANIIIAEDTLENILLYDFTLEKGDTVFGLPLSSTKEQFSELNETRIVTGIDSIELLNGEKRKRISFNNVEPWIEGIGSITGLFNPAYPITTGLYSYQFISCYKQNDVELYHNNLWYNENCCELLTSVIETKENQKSSNLYPVITKDYAFLQINNPLKTIEIRDVFGRCIKIIANTDSGKYTLDFTIYSAGIYFVIVHFNNKHEVYKIIKT